MREDLVIVGAGGFAREAAWIALQQPERWRVRGFLDDSPNLKGGKALGLPILGTVASFRAQHDAKFVIASGSPRIRDDLRRVTSALADDRFALLIDPSVRHHESVRVGAGSIICAGVVATVEIQIGKHVIVNLNSTIGHDCRIGDFCTIAPQAALSGQVVCEDGVEIGTAAAIRQGTHIGRGAMIGMGAVVTRDVGANECVVGNPARLLRTLPPFDPAP